MNPTVQPLKHGVGFRLIPAPSSPMNQQLSPSSTLRQKILCKSKSIQAPSTSGRGSRGKRGHALKFHNFVANDCHSNRSAVNSDQPTFCLREEHGTKQITVSHWKTSHDGQSQDSTEESAVLDMPRGCEKRKGIHQSEEEKQQSILESLLATRMLNQNQLDDDASSQPKKKRSKRKPLIVRRVIHDSDEEAKVTPDCYGERVQYDTNEMKITGDVQEEPLDLSKKEKKFEERGPRAYYQEGRDMLARERGVFPQLRNHKCLPPRQVNGIKQLVRESGKKKDPIEHLIQAVGESAARAASIMASVGSDQLSNNSSTSQPSSYDNSIHGLELQSAPSTSQRSNFKGHVGIDPRINTGCISDQERLIQKQSTQRNVIKQKLEDAFKTNGFLVKTKQVSDGDATFCKFRQLRKYTRYYLKSWHKHLPEEVNKLYKGFLPPNSGKLNGPNNNETE